jgi:hypothetical protein
VFTPLRKAILAIEFISLTLCSVFCWSQASIDENQETVTIYVDAVKGSDSNSGTKLLPLKTVGAGTALAVTNNRAGVGTKVIVNPGTYRESVSMVYSSRDSTLPITIQAATTGAAIISGADVWTGWTVYSGNSSIYTHAWANKWGLCPPEGEGSPAQEDIVRRREMIIVNGSLLMQVLTLSAMRQSTFYVDETKSTAYLWPPSGTNMNTATVEVGTRSSLFYISGKKNLVIRGLTLQYANSCREDSAMPIQGSASNILLDRDYFNWNNATGVKLIQTTDTTVRNSVANHNGVDGMKGLKTKYDLWQDDQTSYNGWRGAQGVYYSWGVAGMHFVKGHNQTVNNVDSSFNQTYGFHWDTDHQNVTADSLLASENLMSGGFSEKNEGPMTVSNSCFCGGAPYTGPNNNAFSIRNSTDLTLTGNTFANSPQQLVVVGQAGGIPFKNWETGESYNLITQDITLTNNVISGGSGQQLFTDGSLNGSDWTKFQTTLSSDYNTWWNTTDTKVFTLPVPKIWTKVDYAGWLATVLTDVHSSWKDPGDVAAACKVTPDKTDFWFVMNGFSGYQTVSRGSAATWTPNVVALAFSGTVSLDSDGVKNIAGVTASWSPKTIVNSGTSTFTVTTTSSTPKGTYPITLIATSGSITRTATVSLIVQ